MGNSNAKNVARRIARSVEATERRRVYRGEGQRPRWFQRNAGGSVRTCIVSANISARSGTTMGSGSVKLVITDPVAGTETVSTAPADVWTVRNSYAVTFAADATKRRKIHWEGGCWKILMGEC